METVAGKYTYSVCPFGPVKQTEHGRLSVVIGSRAKWLDRGPSIYRLLLDDGDSTNCPGGQHRQTTVCISAAVNSFSELNSIYYNIHNISIIVNNYYPFTCHIILPWIKYYGVLKKGKGRALVIAPHSRHGHLRGAQVHGVHQAASHISALYLPSHSWYSFTDPERMEG